MTSLCGGRQGYVDAAGCGWSLFEVPIWHLKGLPVER